MGYSKIQHVVVVLLGSYFTSNPLLFFSLSSRILSNLLAACNTRVVQGSGAQIQGELSALSGFYIIHYISYIIYYILYIIYYILYFSASFPLPEAPSPPTRSRDLLGGHFPSEGVAVIDVLCCRGLGFRVFGVWGFWGLGFRV